MPYSIICTNCSAIFTTHQEMRAGTRLKCAKCRGVFVIPDSAAAPVAQLAAVNITFAWIPPGAFLMGGSAQHNQKPQHRVTISRGFYMGVHPITQAQWEPIMKGYNPSRFHGADRPVEMVTWDDCREFCAKLHKLTGKPTRLPSEAEWEYACRAGTNTEYWNGSEPADLKRVGWFKLNTDGQTQSVGKKPANKWGLFDTHGNVWEWTADVASEYSAENQVDPVRTSSSNPKECRVVRGGCWATPAEPCSAAFRNWYEPGYRDAGVGLRVCFHAD